MTGRGRWAFIGLSLFRPYRLLPSRPLKYPPCTTDTMGLSC